MTTTVPLDLADWSTVEVSSDTSSQPKLRQGEVALITAQANVGLYCNEAKAPLWQSCTATLTSQHVLLCDPLAKSAVGLPLHKILKTSEKQGFGNWSHPKIRLHVSDEKFYMLSFRAGGLEAFLLKLRPAILEALAGNARTFVPAAAGISGIQNSVAARQKASIEVVNNAFTDMKSLASCMQALLDVARKLSHEAPAASSPEETEMRKAFMVLGVADPITRSGHSTLEEFHAGLGKELSSWLHGALPTCGGVMSVNDIYALYNRARGGKDLVSPNDLFHACQCHLSKEPALLFRRMGAGTYLVFSEDWKRKYDAVIKAVDSTSSINDVALARRLNLSVSLARELLLGSEQEGILCRCETRQGIEFYENMFRDPPR